MWEHFISPLHAVPSFSKAPIASPCFLLWQSMAKMHGTSCQTHMSSWGTERTCRGHHTELPPPSTIPPSLLLAMPTSSLFFTSFFLRTNLSFQVFIYFIYNTPALFIMRIPINLCHSPLHFILTTFLSSGLRPRICN